jgi:hypothetical protein
MAESEITVERACCELFRRRVILLWGSFESMQQAAQGDDEQAQQLVAFLGLGGTHANTTLEGARKGDGASAAHA